MNIVKPVEGISSVSFRELKGERRCGNDGSDGAGGLDGAVKSGFFEGKISGQRKDGTAFAYDFTFDRKITDYGDEWGDIPFGNFDAAEGFSHNEDCNCYQLLLVRQDSAFGGNTPSKLGMRLTLKDKGTANEKLYFQYEPQDFGLFFLKELSATSLFRLDAKGFTYKETFVPIPESENSTFEVVYFDDGSNVTLDLSSVEHNGVEYSALHTSDNKSILFEDILNTSATTAEFKYLLDNSGNELSGVSPYDQLRLDKISSAHGTDRYYG